jgi:hypothetical protein
MNAIQKHALRCLVLSLAAVLLGACASTQEQTVMPADPATVADGYEITQDYEYIARVEALARHRNIGVTWVNPPIKRHKLPRDEF